MSKSTYEAIITNKILGPRGKARYQKLFGFKLLNRFCLITYGRTDPRATDMTKKITVQITRVPS